MVNRALLVIDLQEDFLPPNGSLAITNGRSIVNPITQLIQEPLVQNWSLVVATQDWHPINHTSFASQHNVKPFTELEFKHPETKEIKKQFVWPDHCVQETFGATIENTFLEVYEKLKIPKAIVKKGYLQDREYYSCFQDSWGLHHTEIEKLLKDNKIDEVVVVGLAYDYCVLNSAIDSAKSFKTIVVKNLSESVSPESDSKTDEIYKKNGVILVNDISDILQT
ncbi:PNC1 [Candida pseudojiufengensis]|uniref:PNC1 n=1 Tax=Candida pseudojiufengensis TaxID=497109 RepID=UPI0022256DEC|nr:PNC1 [Candida pseudojiufengensis]KAI5959927.1 PNC1 [Candida pseudojiufengensis]